MVSVYDIIYLTDTNVTFAAMLCPTICTCTAASDNDISGMKKCFNVLHCFYVYSGSQSKTCECNASHSQWLTGLAPYFRSAALKLVYWTIDTLFDGSSKINRSLIE